MQRLFGTTALLFWASAASALRLHPAPQNHTPGAHFQNLAGESFDVNKPGEHVLLRAPPESTKNALIRVSGQFSAAAEPGCPLYADTVILKGDWVGSQTVKVSFVNRSLHIKVSSSSPSYAGPWRSIQNWTAAKNGHEAIPDTLKIMKSPDNTVITFYAGTGKLPERPMIKVKRGVGEGLDVALTNLKGFNLPKVAGLLGSYKHNKTIETRSTKCEAAPEKMRQATTAVDRAKAVAAEAVAAEASSAMQSSEFRNIASDKFSVNQPGEFILLRVPKSTELPALIKARGYFVASHNTPCAIFLEKLTLTGAWFGNKTVHVTSVGKVLGIKVSSPQTVGVVRAIRNFKERTEGPEALPSTVKITPLLDDPAFRFQLGPKKPSERANILVTKTRHGALDVSLSHMDRTQVPEIGGLLGMDGRDKTLETPSEKCQEQARKAKAKAKSKPPHVSVPAVSVPAVDAPAESAGEGSLLTASWTA